MNILFIVTTLIVCKIYDQCNLNDYNGIVISKFYRETCPHCQRITPHLIDIDEKFRENNIEFKVRNVECSKCDNCRTERIDAVPTLILTKDKVELGRIRGYHEYNELVTFLISHLDLDRKMFDRGAKENLGKVKAFSENDFYSGFKGPHLLYFYDTISPTIHVLMEELAKMYKEKLVVGEIHKSEAANIAFKYNLTKYPAIIATYDGIDVSFMDGIGLIEYMNFLDRFLEPVMEEINHEKYKELKNDSKTPHFIIFYTNVSLANQAFGILCHKMKMITKIFKTKDKILLRKVAKLNQTENLQATFNKQENLLKLCVLKNGFLHKYEGPLDEKMMKAWIYDAHWPNVINITSENYKEIFDGKKPIMLLVDYTEQFMPKFEAKSVEYQNYEPISDIIFGFLDFYKFERPIKVLLPNIKIPSLIIYDPSSKHFYAEKITLADATFEYIFYDLLKKYHEGQLSRFSKVPYYKLITVYTAFFILFVVIIKILLVITKRRQGRHSYDTEGDKVYEDYRYPKQN